MIFFRSLLLTGFMLVSAAAHSECALSTVQTKMVEITNMMQVYTRQRIAYMGQNGNIPISFERKFNAFDELKNKLGSQLGKETEANPSIGFEAKISPKLCDGYDQLFAEYAPEGYMKKEVNLLPASVDENCTSSSLWNKYGMLIQKQAALAKAGKFSATKKSDMMRLLTSVGGASVTDLKEHVQI